jgi:hypothetical protein
MLHINHKIAIEFVRSDERRNNGNPLMRVILFEEDLNIPGCWSVKDIMEYQSSDFKGLYSTIGTLIDGHKCGTHGEMKSIYLCDDDGKILDIECERGNTDGYILSVIKAVYTEWVDQVDPTMLDQFLAVVGESV